MKKLFLFLFILPYISFSQVRIPITNNMTINSNSNIKFIPGNYVFTDPGADGVIQITGKHDIVLDGDSCTVNGTNYGGYMIKIDNSSNIVIRNFDSVFKYKYAVYITNSNHININGNDFSRNKVDSSGVIDVWANYTQALGGGVMLFQCRAVNIHDNIMKYQNDGVAAYHSDSLKIVDNDFAWNTSFGIRMFWTDTCYVSGNVANHVNRPYTDPSDCAAILMIISNSNTVVNNDFSYSGDGIFLGQYNQSSIPNNNYFAYNECSYSPHNAIEATFADGNVYKHNICNYSPYGFWLGYSFNSLLDSNEVVGNYNSGIAIDRGFNNTFLNNTIRNNPLGIELWKGGAITGYANQFSHDYRIENNTLEGNQVAVSIKTTKHAVIRNNNFLYNQKSSVYLNDSALYDTITGNFFRMPTVYHIQDQTAFDIFANYNSYLASDSALILEKIFDHHISTAWGTVSWYPFIPGPPAVMQFTPSCDMAEPGAVWYAYGDPGYGGKRIPEILSFDATEKMVGNASVKLESGRGYDVAINYRPAGDSVASWSLTDNDTLYFWVRTIKQPTMGFQGFSVRIGDRKGNYYRYTASPTLLNAANLEWKQYKFPLSGGLGFSRSTIGAMTQDQVNYVEIHADTWDYGFTIWVDGVQFFPCDPVTAIPAPANQTGLKLEIFPNPVEGSTTIRFELNSAEKVLLKLSDMNGREIAALADETLPGGTHQVQLDAGNMAPGVYFLNLMTATSSVIRKMVVLNP
jgi:parallel beta-helix repeat protein